VEKEKIMEGAEMDQANPKRELDALGYEES